MKLSHYLPKNDDADIEQKSYKRYDYKAIPVDLLRHYPTVYCSQEEAQINAAILGEVVSRFLKAEVTVGDIILGPQITRYELSVPNGVSLKAVKSHCADIAYELAAVGGVRVEAPIPGRSAVAIEVPNKNRVAVGLRDVISSPTFSQLKSPIPFALGKSASGNPLVCDLEKTPHLLIAGKSGRDKSAALNSLIVSLMYKSSPEDVRLILIDPERTAFSKFAGMPHLLFDKIVTKPIEAVKALEWADKEMNRRYTVFTKYGCRNLSDYNRLPEVEDGTLTKLPHIVIIIDELAVLMQSLLCNVVESKISCIAALARAAGLHLIAATCHPTTNIITGTVKANLTSRIAYRVAKAMDSRVIIDVDGAESLIGDGDMLYYPQEAFEPRRGQGTFVEDEEVLSVVDYAKNLYECDFDEQAGKYVSGGEEDEGGIENDPVLPQAVAYVVKKGWVSVTTVERRFDIGRAKAALMVDYMEEQGYIEPYGAKRPRRVLLTREEYKELYGKDVDDV